MALQSALNFCGISVPESYTHIHLMSHDKGRNATLIWYSTYANVSARASGESPLRQGIMTAPYGPTLGIVEAYAHLKSLPEFAGAIDV